MTKSIFIQFNRLSPQSRLLLPLGHIRDVMLVWRKQNINRTVSVLQYRVPVRAVLADHSTVSGFDLAWFSSLSFERLLSLVFMVLCIFNFFVTFFTF